MVRKLKSSNNKKEEKIEVNMGDILTGMLGGALGGMAEKLKVELEKSDEVEVPIEVFEDRTKHFLFYTAGVDSTLIMEDILKVMEYNKRDKLVLMVVMDQFLGSGGEFRVKETLETLEMRMELLKRSKANVYNRVKVNVLKKEIVSSSSVVEAHKRKIMERMPINLFGDSRVDNIPDCDNPNPRYFFANKSKKMHLQEMLLVNNAYNIVLLSENCRNRVYIGQNGGDIGNSNFDRLNRMFNEKVEFMVKDMMGESSLNQEMLKISKRAVNNMSYFDPEMIKKVIPTLEFPLRNTKKELIFDRLKKEYPRAIYEVAGKIEDAAQQYAGELIEEIQMYQGLIEKMKHFKGEYTDVMPFNEYVRNNCEKFYYVTKTGGKIYQDEAFIADAVLMTRANMMKKGAMAAGIL